MTPPIPPDLRNIADAGAQAATNAADIADETALIEALAERQWQRMTRSSVPYADLNEWEKRACRALVAPVLSDVRELEES